MALAAADLGSYMEEDMTPEVAMLTGLARRVAPDRMRTPLLSVLMAEGGRLLPPWCALDSRLKPGSGEGERKAGLDRKSRENEGANNTKEGTDTGTWLEEEGEAPQIRVQDI